MPILTGQDAATELFPEASEMRRRMLQTDAIGDRMVDAVLPELGRNYNQSGLKVHTGRLYAGIVRRGAEGNRISIQRTGIGGAVTVRVGVDYGVIRYARWVLEGRGPVVAKRAKALRFMIDGKLYFRKRVGPAPAHDVYHVTDEMVNAAHAKIIKFIAEGE